MHGNIAEELNNYDVMPLQGQAASNLGVRRATSSCATHQRSLKESGALLEATNSQLTARFSQFQNPGVAAVHASALGRSHSSLNQSQLLTQSQCKSASHLNFTQQASQSGALQKNSARKNIKQNTKCIRGEIAGVDNEIAML